MLTNGPLKISKSFKKAENGPFGKNLFPITAFISNVFQNRYGNRLIRLITKIGFRLLTDNRFQNFSDYTTLPKYDINPQHNTRGIGMFAVTSRLGLVGREATTVTPH